jgi:predicted Zn-dependent protease
MKDTRVLQMIKTHLKEIKTKCYSFTKNLSNEHMPKVEKMVKHSASKIKAVSSLMFKKLKRFTADLVKNLNKENLLIFKNHVYKHKKIYMPAAAVSLTLIVVGGYYISKKFESIGTLNTKYSITSNVAEEYYYSGKYDEAVNEYNVLIEKDARDGLWDAKIAEIYSVKGDINNSKLYLDKALSLGNKNSEVINYIIFTEFMNKDYQSALAHGTEALKLFPQDKSLMKTMFTVYMANNDLEKAKKLVSEYPVSSNSAYDKAEYARMLMVSGNLEEGFKHLKNAWFLDRDEYKVYDVLAQLSVYNRDTLLEALSTLADKEPETVAYKVWLAKIYSLSEASANEAEKVLSELKAKSQDIGDISIKLIEASILQNTKQDEKADELIQQVIEEHKEDYRVLHTAGWYYLNKKDYVNADKYCRQSIIKNKDYTDNYGFLMPEILKAQGKTQEGEPYFRTALLKEPYNYNIMLTLADYYWHTAKDSGRALEYFKLAEIVKPDEPEIKYNMAFISIADNKVEEAVKLLNQCIKLSDSTPKYHRTLGTLYLLNNKPKEAISEIRYAYGSDQEDILTLNNAGCYYVTQDVNLDKGEFNLRKAVEGITPETDKYTADKIKENYNKVKQLMDKYNNGTSNQTLEIPDLELFY